MVILILGEKQSTVYSIIYLTHVSNESIGSLAYEIILVIPQALAFLFDDLH